MAEEFTKQATTLAAGTAQVLPKDLFAKKLARNKPLVIKLGVDPTAPDLHLGHAVILEKLRQFQDAGHHVIFLIGDFTARIGDPSGKSKTRPALSEEEIKQNAQSYFDQVGKILDRERTEVRYNAEWFSGMSLAEWMKISGKTTVARIIEREDFATRLKEKSAVGFHELFYPLLQGYDSVMLKADVELGGTDQTFNLLMGRHMQECYEQEPQVIMTMPLLEGLDGQQKMSKSLGNHVGLAEDAAKAFGKIMSISDVLMWRYYTLLLGLPKEDSEQMQQGVKAGTKHPMELKKELATQIISRYWSADEAQAARKRFEAVFQKHDYTQAESVSLAEDTPSPVWIVVLLKQLGAVKTSSEAKRLIESGSVHIDEKVITDFKAEVSWRSGMTVKVGKHRIYTIK